MTIESKSLIPLSPWASDSDAIQCESCQNEFLVYRRRHHCRNCGGVFCSDCAHAKIPLPQLGIPTPVRVCLLCVKVAHTVGSALSNSEATRHSASQSLSRLTASPETYTRLLQYGGIEAACLLLKDSSPDTQAGASMALYHITRDPSERERLASKGVVEALYGVVRRRKADDLTMKHCLGGLCLCASTQSIAPRLVKNDHLRLLLDCVSDTSAFTTSRILAIRIVLALARQESVQEAIVMDKNGALKRLVQCLELPEEDLVVVTAQSLAFLSTGSEPIKTRIVQCDTALHSVLCRTAEKWSTSVSVLSNISCTIANLASVTSDSSRLLIPGTTAGVLCVIANTHEDSYEIQRHCGRGLGNLSVVPTNALRLLPYLGTTIVRMLHSSNVTVRSHALRVMDNLTVVTMATPTRQQVAELIKEDPQCQPIGTRLQLLVDQMGDNRTGRIATTIVERLQSIDTTTPHTAYGTNSATDTSHDTSSILDTAAEDQEWMRTP